MKSICIRKDNHEINSKKSEKEQRQPILELCFSKMFCTHIKKWLSISLAALCQSTFFIFFDSVPFVLELFCICFYISMLPGFFGSISLECNLME